MQELFNIVVPVFAIILAGYASRRFGLLHDASAEALNRFAYYIAVPPLLFLSTARMPVHSILNWPFISAYLAAALLTLIVAVTGGRLLFGHREFAVLTLHGFGAVFANTVYMGIPLFLAAYGAAGAGPAVVGAVASNLVFIGATVLLLEISQHRHRGPVMAIIEVLKSLFSNPVLAGAMLGLAASALQLALPTPLERFLELLSRSAGPCALFALGLSLFGFPIRAGVGEIAWITVLKLILHPLITWVIVGPILELDRFWAATAVLLAAMPSGAMVFVFAQKYDVYIQRSATVVVVTTTLSLVTLGLLFSWYGTLTPPTP